MFKRSLLSLSLLLVAATVINASETGSTPQPVVTPNEVTPPVSPEPKTPVVPVPASGIVTTENSTSKPEAPVIIESNSNSSTTSTTATSSLSTNVPSEKEVLGQQNIVIEQAEASKQSTAVEKQLGDLQSTVVEKQLGDLAKDAFKPVEDKPVQSEKNTVDLSGADPKPVDPALTTIDQDAKNKVDAEKSSKAASALGDLGKKALSSVAEPKVADTSVADSNTSSNDPKSTSTESSKDSGVTAGNTDAGKSSDQEKKTEADKNSDTTQNPAGSATPGATPSGDTSSVKPSIYNRAVANYNRVVTAGGDFFGKTYDRSLGAIAHKIGICKADALKDRNGVKTAIVLTASAAVVYACYVAWKKYFAPSQEEVEENPFITRSVMKSSAK